MASAQGGKKKSAGGAKAAAGRAAPKKPSAKAAPAKKAGAKAISAKKAPAKKAPAKGTAAKKAAPAKRNAARKGAAKSAAAKGGASRRRASAQARPKSRARGVQENPLASRSSALFMEEIEAAPRGRAQGARRAANAAGSGSAKRSGAGAKGSAAAPRKQLAPEVRREERARAPRRRSGGSGRGYGVVNLALICAIVLLAGVGVWRTLEYRALAEMKAVVARDTFYAGTTVEGVDVSEMTLAQALEYWDKQIEPAHRQAAVVLDDGTRVTAIELGYTSDYADVLSGAWNAGRTGSLRQRYLRASAGSAEDYAVTRANFDDARVRQYVAALAAQTDAPPQDAHVASFNLQTYSFEFAPESAGSTLDQEALVNAIESALNAGGGAVSRQISTSAPGATVESVAAQYGMIASAVTNAETSSDNRIANIRLAASIINGTRLKPGEQFSFNQVVGERTASRGFKVATAYSSGTVTEEVGGGICQVSTTLFNAAVKADLQIDERHPHSLTVGYVDLGKDAAVDWGGKDLKFTNTSDDDVYICSMVTDDKRIRFGIFGKLLPNGESITVEGVKTGQQDFETKYQLSFELYSGQTRKVQDGKPGYTATAYKIRWDADGNEIGREELCKSKYQATPEIIEYGP